jgi:hypothetical protein
VDDLESAVVAAEPKRAIRLDSVKTAADRLVGGRMASSMAAP